MYRLVLNAMFLITLLFSASAYSLGAGICGITKAYAKVAVNERDAGVEYESAILSLEAMLLYSQDFSGLDKDQQQDWFRYLKTVYGDAYRGDGATAESIESSCRSRREKVLRIFEDRDVVCRNVANLGAFVAPTDGAEIKPILYRDCHAVF